MNKQNKQKFDSIQAQALRIASGAVRGTSNAAMQVDMGEPPLQLDDYNSSYSTLSRLNQQRSIRLGKFLNHIGPHYAGNILKTVSQSIVTKARNSDN